MKVYRPKSIPSNYKYVDVTRDYIDFYNKGSFRNESTTYYRVYYNYNEDLAVAYNRTFGSTYTTYFAEVPTSSSFYYRKDIDGIFVITAIIVVFSIWLINLVTSLVVKGGVFGNG